MGGLDKHGSEVNRSRPESFFNIRTVLPQRSESQLWLHAELLCGTAIVTVPPLRWLAGERLPVPAQ